MSIESKDDFLVLLDDRIRRISKEVAAELVGQPSQSSDPLIKDLEAANIQKALPNNGQAIHLYKRRSSIALLFGRSYSQPG
jgi:hypothetical protein